MDSRINASRPRRDVTYTAGSVNVALVGPLRFEYLTVNRTGAAPAEVSSPSGGFGRVTVVRIVSNCSRISVLPPFWSCSMMMAALSYALTGLGTRPGANGLVLSHENFKGDASDAVATARFGGG